MRPDLLVCFWAQFFMRPFLSRHPERVSRKILVFISACRRNMYHFWYGQCWPKKITSRTIVVELSKNSYSPRIDTSRKVVRQSNNPSGDILCSLQNDILLPAKNEQRFFKSYQFVTERTCSTRLWIWLLGAWMICRILHVVGVYWVSTHPLRTWTKWSWIIILPPQGFIEVSGNRVQSSSSFWAMIKISENPQYAHRGHYNYIPTIRGGSSTDRSYFTLQKCRLSNLP